MNGESRLSTTLATFRGPTIALLRDVLARVVTIKESLECGDSGSAYAVARDLEDDLAGDISRLEEWREAA